jgi:hypothetical protein
VALCEARGVIDARVFDVMKLKSDEPLGRFDSLLFGMQTIGVAGGLDTLGQLLERLKGCLAPGAELIVDSSALREAWDGDQEDLSASRGEIVLSTRYRGWRGEPFPWIYLGENELREVALDAGYEMEMLGSVSSGEFLASLHFVETR